MDKAYKRDIENAAKVTMTARIMGVSKRYVRMVINDERKNDDVLACYMQLQEAAQAMEVKMMRRVMRTKIGNQINYGSNG